MTEPTSTATCVEAEPFALQVLDDSMEPEFERGCIVVIDPTGRLEHGAFVLAELEGAYVLRQLEVEASGVRLRALNRCYPCVTPAQGLDVVRGVVVQRAGTRRAYHKSY